MPHNSAGKLDRRLLQQTVSRISTDELAQYLSGQRKIFRECLNEIEVWIRPQWAHVLHLPAKSISVDDYFYHLGDDSIRIVTLAKAILDEYEVTLGLSILNNKHKTVSSMAKFVENAAKMLLKLGQPWISWKIYNQLSKESRLTHRTIWPNTRLWSHLRSRPYFLQAPQASWERNFSDSCCAIAQSNPS